VAAPVPAFLLFLRMRNHSRTNLISTEHLPIPAASFDKKKTQVLVSSGRFAVCAIHAR
jgi:hypothetical protein